MKKKFRDRST
jgi:hypothetical protein